MSSCRCVGVTATLGDVKGNDEVGDAGFSASFHQPLSTVETLKSATLQRLCRVCVRVCVGKGFFLVVSVY